LGMGLVSWSLILDGQYVLFQVEDTPRPQPQRQQELSLRSMWLGHLEGMRNMEQGGSPTRPKTHSPSPPPPQQQQQRRPPNLVLPPLPSRAGGGGVGVGAAAAVAAAAVRAGSGEGGGRRAEGASSSAQGSRTSPSAAARGSARRSLFSNEVAPLVPARGDEGGQVRTLHQNCLTCVAGDDDDDACIPLDSHRLSQPAN